MLGQCDGMGSLEGHHLIWRKQTTRPETGVAISGLAAEAAVLGELPIGQCQLHRKARQGI